MGVSYIDSIGKASILRGGDFSFTSYLDWW